MKNIMYPYTDTIKLTLDDLIELRERYNNAGEFSDYGFMHELFLGLDSIIEVYKKMEGE